MADRRKLIFDCDTGTDDAVALMSLLLSDNVDVIGVTSVHGNRPVENTTDNNLRLVEFLGMDVPVYKGCACALVRGLSKGRELNTRMQRVRAVVDGEEIRIHEATLKLPAAKRGARPEHACSFIVDTLRAAREPIDIAAVGPLTNIAVALRMAPEIAQKIGTLYIMGGGLRTGNRTPVAEANFYDDPEAAEIVLTSGANILLGPIEGNVSGATYTLDDIAAIEALGNRTGRWTAQLLRDFIARCRILFGGDPASCCIHDYAAVAPAIDPLTATDVRREICRVDFSGGMADGQLVVDRRGAPAGDSTVRVVCGMDAARTHALLLSLLKKAE
ncbi:MAG: nucleoside hydrolase [Oscillospiraceae bacterium]|nr:nucleoside hydrolase [Oscillospiraceae bacterium]